LHNNYKMIIGFAGKKGSGKDTLGNYLIEKYKFERYAFGDPVKEVCRILFGFNDQQLYGDKKEEIDISLGIKPREAFQKIGTDFGRKIFHELFPGILIPEGQLWINIFTNNCNHRNVVLHRPKRKMRNQSVYDRIDYSLKSEAFQEQNIIIFSDVKAPKRLVST